MIKIQKVYENFESKTDNFIMGLYFILDGLIAVLSFGTYTSSYGSDKIIQIILKNIELRKRKQ